jgi:hypothetical protein
MKLLVSFYWDCGRQGSLDGLFITTQEQLNTIIGKRIYFGEVLGKHSEIYGTLEEKDITVKSNDQDFINKLEEIIGSTTISGFNPFGYYEPEEDE